MKRFTTIAGGAAAILLAGTISASAAIVYTSLQGDRADGSPVPGDRSVLSEAYDGDASTFYSLGMGGSITATSTLGVIGGSVIEVTFGTINPSFPESAEIYLDYGLGTQTLFGEIFNNNTPFTFDNTLGTITKDSQSGNTTQWTMALNGPPFGFTNITLLDTTVDSTGVNSDGFDVGEFSVSEVPLPASLLMLLGALGGLGVISRRRKAA